MFEEGGEASHERSDSLQSQVSKLSVILCGKIIGVANTKLGLFGRRSESPSGAGTLGSRTANKYSQDLGKPQKSNETSCRGRIL